MQSAPRFYVTFAKFSSAFDLLAFLLWLLTLIVLVLTRLAGCCCVVEVRRGLLPSVMRPAVEQRAHSAHSHVELDLIAADLAGLLKREFVKH